ncbi:MAG: DUF2569 domain-containing protein [Bauldia sp.]|nr:DUF2569 domain-containing protein [Bauldia sp.]
MTFRVVDPDDPNGISGWLFLSAAGLVVGTATEILVLALFVRAQAPQIPLESASGFDSFWSYWLLSKAALVALSLVTVFGFLRRKRYAPRLVVALMALSAGQLVVQTLLAAYDNEDAGVVQLSAAWTVVSLFNALVWIPYFLTSKRVAATFQR